MDGGHESQCPFPYSAISSALQTLLRLHEHLLLSRHCSKHFMSSMSFNPHSNPLIVTLLSFPFSEEESEHKDSRGLAQGHTTSGRASS